MEIDQEKYRQVIALQEDQMRDLRD